MRNFSYIIKETDKSAIFSIFILSAILVVFSTSWAAVTVTTVAQLQQKVSAANSGGDKTILIQPGTYNLNGVYLRITANGVTVRGATKKRGDVILDGNYVSSEIFQVVSSNVTIGDLTLKHAIHHPIHIIANDSADVNNTMIDNIHLIDPGQQAIKINQNSAKTHSVNYGTVRNSLLELTDSGRNEVWNINGSCYTGGVDAHHATGWQIRDNEIRGFWCEGSLAEHGVHFWSDSQDTLVERNRIIDCDRGIGFGLGGSGHKGGIIRNNMIYHGPDHGFSDVGIGLESASGASVYNNTIFHEHPYPNTIEYRFKEAKNNYIANNLTNKSITSRNDGTAILDNNHTKAQAEWFADTAVGNLHLIFNVPEVVNNGSTISGLVDDFDKQARPAGSGIDIGADEREATSTPSYESRTLNATYHLLLSK